MLETEWWNLQERRKQVEIPVINREMLSGLVDNLEKVIAEGMDPQRKDLLRRMVKKVLVHDRRTIEIWYRLPNPKGSNTLTFGSPNVNLFVNWRVFG